MFQSWESPKLSAIQQENNDPMQEGGGRLSCEHLSDYKLSDPNSDPRGPCSPPTPKCTACSLNWFGFCWLGLGQNIAYLFLGCSLGTQVVHTISSNAVRLWHALAVCTGPMSKPIRGGVSATRMMYVFPFACWLSYTKTGMKVYMEKTWYKIRIGNDRS